MKLLFDAMLKRTAKWCRVFGIDSSYAADKDDTELLKIAKKDGRTLVTKDAELASRCKSGSVPFLLLESDILEEQIAEIVKKTGATFSFPDNTRCSACNGGLVIHPKEEVKDKVIPEVFKRHEKFWVCNSCGKAYWEGSHWKNITAMFERVKKEIEQSA